MTRIVSFRKRALALAIVATAAGMVVPTTGAAATPARAPLAAPPVKPVPLKTAAFGIASSNGSKPDARGKLTFLTSPGGAVTDHIAVQNLSTRALTLRLYAADAIAGPDGSVGYQPRAATQRDAATWITPALRGSGDVITVRARKTRIIALKVDVPAKAEPGDHLAGIIASLTSKVRTKSGQLIDFDQRVALPASFRIGGALRPELSVQDLHAEYANSLNPFGAGSATVSYTVRNTGNVSLGARQQVTVSGLFGEESAPAVATLPFLLPGSSVRMNVTVPDVLPQVRLTGRVTLYPLTVKGASDPGLAQSFTATTGFWGVPWALLVVIVLLVALAFAVRAMRRHPRFTDNARHRTRPAAVS